VLDLRRVAQTLHQIVRRNHQRRWSFLLLHVCIGCCLCCITAVLPGGRALDDARQY
jgi:hypothetical protein